MNMASSSAFTLDDLEHSVASNPTENTHLSYPVVGESTSKENSDGPSEREARPLLTDRLYIGNLHPSVDEYSLLQVFSKFGKVTKLDFLFHKTGALKGKPRGYAFIEYGNQDDALKALTSAHDKLLRGRKIVVTFAQQAPLDQHGGVIKNRRMVTDASKPTTLSMIKTGLNSRNESKTQDKIAMMEAKLRQMESTNPQPKPNNIPANPLDIREDASSSIPLGKSTLPYHPSLPMKPPPQLPSHLLPQTTPRSTLPAKPKNALPSLPIAPSAPVVSNGSSKTSSADYLKSSVSRGSPPVLGVHSKPGKTAKLLGVKIKPKEVKGKQDPQTS